MEQIGMTKEEAAQALGIGVATLGRLMRDGEIAYAKVGERVIFHREALEEFIRSRTAPHGRCSATIREVEREG